MPTVHEAYVGQEADYPTQPVFTINEAVRQEMAFSPLPLGTVYRILRVERFPSEAGYFNVVVSAIEFLEYNLGLWEGQMSLLRAAERLHYLSFVMPADIDLGPRILDPRIYIPSREFLQNTLIELAPFPIEAHDSKLISGLDVACQRLANECLVKGDNASVVSLLVRHLVYTSTAGLTSRDVA